MKKLFFIAFIISLFSCGKHYDVFHSKSKWMTDYFYELKSGNYSGIYAISWWNENFDKTYLKINSSDKTLKTFQSLVNDNLFISTCEFTNNKLAPVEDKIYFSAFPDFFGTEDSVTLKAINDFENLAQKEIAWAYFSNNWLDSLIFPAQDVQTIANSGKTPFIRIMFRSEFEEFLADPKLSLLDIIKGIYDEQITNWANDAKNCEINLLVEFGTEVNGSWFPWNGFYYGAGKTDCYGDLNYPDGPEIFRDAYRHVIDICKQLNANNITWFYHFDVNDEPEEWWNTPKYYYPGDEYIDWIGVSTYGSFKIGDEYVEPKDLLQKAYIRLKEISTNKPYAILEFGITEL